MAAATSNAARTTGRSARCHAPGPPRCRRRQRAAKMPRTRPGGDHRRDSPRRPARPRRCRFPTGTKWRSIVTGGGRHHYAVCNAAEGEPGTFKDRALLRANPYQVLEGLLVAAHTVGAIEAFIALKASFGLELDRVRVAIDEITQAGWLATSRSLSSQVPRSTSSARRRPCSK